MSGVFFISDLHLGHHNIHKWSPSRGGTNTEEHDEWLIKQANSVLTKNSILYILGDITLATGPDGEYLLSKIGLIKGQKKLILGNHDKLPLESYTRYFREIHGFLKYKKFWLSHAPIHPEELRHCKNIHGHVHSATIPDDRYINVSVEALNGIPVSLEELRTTK